MNGRCYLKKSQDFSLVHVNGSWSSSRILNLKYIANNLGYSRFGIITSKKTGNAVTRNHVKRQLREILKHHNIKEGFDIVIVARQCITTVDYQHIDSTVYKLLSNNNLINN